MFGLFFKLEMKSQNKWNVAREAVNMYGADLSILLYAKLKSSFALRRGTRQSKAK